MLKFFRKNRRKLLQQHRVTRYMAYALGEIVLVMIGILLVLQVNTWNEGRKALDQEKRKRAALHNEIEENLKELRIDINRLSDQNRAQRKLLGFFGANTIPEAFELDNLISESFLNLTWNPISYVLNDLKNSGQISRISDPNLQLLLFVWERHYENLEEFTNDDEKCADAFLNFLRQSSAMRNIDYTFMVGAEEGFSKSSFGFSNVELLKQLRFENVVDDKLMTTRTLKQQYEKTIVKMEEILKAVQP